VIGACLTGRACALTDYRNFQIVELQKGIRLSAQFVCDHRRWLTSKGGNYRYKNASSLQGFNKTAKIAIAGK